MTERKKRKVYKSPLEGLAEADKRGEIDWDKVREEAAEAREEQRKDEEDRYHGRGKYAPPEGVCVVCSGKAVAKITNRYLGDPMHMIIGPGSRNQMTRTHHGWHCVSCGLKYEFCPKGPPGKDAL